MGLAATRPIPKVEASTDFRRQHAALGLGQQQCRDDQQAVGDEREHADRLAERKLGAQHADEHRIERGDAAAKIIGEPLPRAAHPRREQFGEERPHAGEDARGEEAEGEAEPEHQRIVDRQLRVHDHRSSTARTG